MLRTLDLFSGIGGFSLGLERTQGFKTVAFCECDPFARRVLAKHWPKVPQYDDVRTLTAARLAADGISVDVICGGFPCQDISLAGSGAGLAGMRSGLWYEYLRLVSEIRPAWVIAENVSALRSRGLDTVLRGLASIGFDAEWHCIPAAAVGAPHRRDRIWLVAHPNADRGGRQIVGQPEHAGEQGAPRRVVDGLGPDGQGDGQDRWGWWTIEPDVGRMAYGVPKRVDRLRALGNAVVPHIPEMLGRAILARAA